MIEQAHRLAQSYLIRYNTTVLEKIIRDGVIPEGAIIERAPGQKLVREGGELVAYKKVGGDWTSAKRMQITDNLMPKILVQYAVTAACSAAEPIMMGSPNYK
jgi:hypothetical protein